MTWGSRFTSVMLVVILSACTGGKTSLNASPDQGGFRITPGEGINLDMTDLMELGLPSDLVITLKQASDDYKSTKTLMDLTDLIVKTPSANNHYKLILPKDIANIRPLIFSVEAPSLRAQFYDIIYADTSAARPGIASSLAYELLKYYPGKTLSSFSSSDFGGIKNLIQTRMEQVKAEAEHLSLASVRFDRVMRYYKNSLAFNPPFLTAVAAYGINYTYSLLTPTNVSIGDTPEASLASYQYATAFKVGGVTPLNNPFNQTNNPTRLAGATPGLGLNISAQEGSIIQLTANAVDPDDDFIDKSMIVKYAPRVLPLNLPHGIDHNNPPFSEPSTTNEIFTDLGKPADPATYTSAKIAFNEALNQLNYNKGLLASTPCVSNDTDPDCGKTGIKNIYLMVSDGMVRIPYHWSFSYVDVNRAPKIIVTSGVKNINTTELDDQTALQNPAASFAINYGGLVPPAEGPSTIPFRQHASHCETDYNVLEQNVRSRADGPWSCAFKVFDPDLDDDPNAAIDNYFYSVDNYESSTEIVTNGQKISPAIGGVIPVNGAILSTCTDSSGIIHRNCGLALYKITVDNSVKIAAASKASLEYSYDVVVTDRVANGFVAAKTVSRKIKFTPIPPRLVKFDQRAPPGGSDGIGKTYSDADQLLDPTHVASTYARHDIYIDEILSGASANSINSSDVGFRDDLITSVNRPAFDFTVNGETASASSFLTQPRAVLVNNPTFNASGDLQSFNPVAARLLGNALAQTFPTATPPDPTAKQALDANGNTVTTSVNSFTNDILPAAIDPATQSTYDAAYYSYPREYDNTCKLDSNNVALNGSNIPIWDQRPIRDSNNNSIRDGGWTFELDAVDLDNLDLRASEPYEPIYLSIANDANQFGISGLIQYCIYNEPNPDTLNYRTYSGSTFSNVVYQAKNAENCNYYSNSPPLSLQPVSVFYNKKNADNSLSPRKMVYHRLRMKWQPKDHAVVTNFIKNHLTSLLLYGDRYRTIPDKNDLEAKQDVSSYSSIELVASRKNHQACISTAQSTYPSRYFVLHDNNQITNDLTFNALDENRMGELGNAAAASGRYQAEVYSASGNAVDLKAIDTIAFSRFVPFVYNCTSLDGSIVADPKPVTWYAGTDKLPRTRLTTSLLTTPTITYPFCLRYRYTPYREPSAPNRVFDKVVLFQSTGAAVLNLSTFTESGQPCFTEASFTFSANDRYAALATPCSTVSYSSGGITGTTLSNFDPTLAANGAFPAGTSLRMKFFPSFYGADYGANDNTFQLDFAAVDTFVYDLTSGLAKAVGVRTESPLSLSQYDDKTLLINTTADPTQLGPVALPLGGMTSSMLLGYVDWDHQPSSVITGLGPTPAATPAITPATNVFYRANSSGGIEIYIKGTASATIPIQALDRIPSGTGIPTGIETDPFDILQFVNLTPQTGYGSSVGTPSFSTPSGRTSCTDAPGGSGAAYLAGILSGTLGFNALQDYRGCLVNWTPDASDIGKKYNYQFQVQDNYGATADSSNLRTAMGIGAIHPTGIQPGAGFSIANDSWAYTHSPYSTFYLKLESIETNLPPYFVDGSGTNNAKLYCTSVSASTGCASATPSADWATIFGGTGVQPPCSAGTGFSCPAAVAGESIQDGDTVLASAPIKLEEGATTNISVLVRDDNISFALRTVNANAPRKVLVVNKVGNSIQSYTVPTFTSMTLGASSSVQTDGKTSTVFSFDWSPTDAEAYQLSNADGFLIPFTVADQDYIPAADSQFPEEFKVRKITRTIWVWAQVKVKNTPPQVYYIDPATNLEVPLAGATLTFETGQNKTFTVRLRDTDRARYDIGSETTPFSSTTISKPSFLSDPQDSPSPATMTPSGNNLYQEYTVNNNRTLTPSDIGTTAYNFTLTDPGDPSKCWISGGPAVCVPGARATITDTGIGFNVQVVGKPYFLVPHTILTATPTPGPENMANVFVNSTSNVTIFNYPLSLSISKDAEKGQAFFFGISGAEITNIPMRTTVPPASTPTPATAKGIYVNQNYVVKWPDAPYAMVGTTVKVPIQAVMATHCGSGSAVTLYRFNETTNSIETCGLSAADVTNNTATEYLYLKVNNNYEVPTLANITATLGSRTTTHSAVDATAAKAAASAQYAGFKGRCPACSSVPTNGGGSSPSGLFLNPSATSDIVQFSASNYSNTFNYSYDGSSTLSVIRSHADAAPTTARTMTFPILKGDSAHFEATISTVPSINQTYRWFVNGCLKKSGQISSTTASFDLPVTLLMAGLNNDCTGEYSITEANADRLGTLRVRLTVVNNIENTSTTSDGSTKNYNWTVNVLNNKPNLQSGITLASYTGNTPVNLAMPVSYGSKPYLAYVDPHSSAGAAFHMIEVLANGNLSSNEFAAIRSGITSSPTTLGVATSPSLKIAMNNISTYPSSSSESASLFKTSSRSYGAGYGGSWNAWDVSQSYNDVAGYSVFANNMVSSIPAAVYQTTAGGFDFSRSTDFYLIDGQDGYGYRSVREYWQNNINSGASIYGGNTNPLSNGAGVRKNIVTGTGASAFVFQLIGAKSSTANGAVSSINIRSLAASGTTLGSSNIKKINFSSTGSAPDCPFDGTPIDGTYIPATDTLFVLAYGSTGSGRILTITNATNASASCSVIASVANPSLNAYEFNSSASKSMYDSTNQFIHGVIVRTAQLGSQLYYVDTLTNQVYTQDLSSAINPSSIIFSKEVNSTFLIDGDKTSTKTPKLYKIW